MQACGFGREVDIARCRSVVNVAIPQRRGNELPITAILRSGVTSAPRRGLSIAEQPWRLVEQDWSMARRAAATENRLERLPDRRPGPATRLRRLRCWYVRPHRRLACLW